jgi:carbonic anhydrase
MRFRFIAALLAATLPTLAEAAWQIISTDQGKRVEIDRSSIKKETNGKVVGLGRIVLDKPINDPKTSASYRIIEALSRYDCAQRTYSTVKRRYFQDEGDLLREEEVKTQLEMPVRSGTLDDKLLREVCRPRPGAEALAAASQTAEKASAAADELRKANAALLEKEVARDVKRANMKTPAPAQPEPAATPDAPPRATARTRGSRRHPAPMPIVDHEPVAYAHAQIHWSYEGEGGPGNWDKLKGEFAICASGKRQSPIDIRDGIGVDLEPIQFAYRASQFRVVDNGHTVQVAVGGSSISLLGKVYELVQFHFHRPSEERVNGKAFDMVVHLVHKAEDGKIAVVAVLLEQGKDNPVIQTVWNNLPLEKNEDVAPPASSIDVAQLLPESRSYYTYMGSLTTPPCSEGVLWLVLKQPQQLSAEQLAIFARLYPNNARPIQPGFSRLIKESR